MLKTICVKTNNKEISEYLLKELEYFELQSIQVSSYKFKVYTNIIIHYKGKNVELFLNKKVINSFIKKITLQVVCASGKPYDIIKKMEEI